jgi:hypothetical protein
MTVKFLVIGTGNAIVSVHNKTETATAACEKHNRKFPAMPAYVAESNTTICSCKAGETAVTVADAAVKAAQTEKTVSYIAKPSYSRCAWWSVQLPADIELSSERIPAPYLQKGTDLELKEGDMLIDSEANHHRKNRGYNVVLVVCVDGEVKFIKSTAKRKAYIKEHGGQDLMHSSGDVAGCVRMAVWLRRQPNLAIAFQQLTWTNSNERARE